MAHGEEIRFKLLSWDKGQAASEGLSSSILKSEGYNVDPSHPLGGPDGRKDSICQKDGLSLVGASFFPRGQESFTKIKEKLVTVLNDPANFNIRLEYLDIQITKEELLAFHAARDREYLEKMAEVNSRLDALLGSINEGINEILGNVMGGDSFCSLHLANISATTNRGLIGFWTFGKYRLYNVKARVADLDSRQEIFLNVGELAPGITSTRETIDLGTGPRKRYNIFFTARNGRFTQQLRYVKVDNAWIAASRITMNNKIVLVDVPPAYPLNESGEVDW